MFVINQRANQRTAPPSN